MSPEQVRAKELDARSDLFSFGAGARTATGALPFHGESWRISKAILDAAPTSAIRLNADVPPKLEDIINKALEKDRNLRYQSAAQIHRFETPQARMEWGNQLHIAGRNLKSVSSQVLGHGGGCLVHRDGGGWDLVFARQGERFANRVHCSYSIRQSCR